MSSLYLENSIIGSLFRFFLHVFLENHFAKYQNASPQEPRSRISWQIQREIFFAVWSLRPKPQKNQRT